MGKLKKKKKNQLKVPTKRVILFSRITNIVHLQLKMCLELRQKSGKNRFFFFPFRKRERERKKSLSL